MSLQKETPNYEGMISPSMQERAYYSLRSNDVGRVEKIVEWAFRLYENRSADKNAFEKNIKKALARKVLEDAYANNLLTDDQRDRFIMCKLAGRDEYE